MTNVTNSNSLPWWRFLLPFGVQLLIILFIPARSAYTYNFGQNVVIQTRPIDPYDLLRGYSQTLSYDISDVNTLKKLPGKEYLKEREIFYLLLQKTDSYQQQPPLPWTPIKILKNTSQNLSENQIIIQGKVTSYRTATYGLETYYMPESRRNKINQEISQLQRQEDGTRPFLVEIKVDRAGYSVPVSLWIGDREYRF